MSVDPEFVESLVSAAAVGLAALHQVWCVVRERARPRTPAQASAAWRAAAARRRRAANRWMAAALLLNLVLSAAATLEWADDGIRGAATTGHPPLLLPLVLLAVGAGVSAAVSITAHPGVPPAARPGPARLPDPGRRTA